MIAMLSCEETINYLLKNGATIIEDKSEGKLNFCGKKVLLQKDNCQFKISYLNLEGKEVTVEKTCCCKGRTMWNSIPDKCFK